MNFLEALNEFIIKGNNPDRIIFDVVNQAIHDFSFFKKMKYPKISDIRFESLAEKTYENLIKEGFKSICKCSIDDDDARTRLSYLISQYYNTQYTIANPRVKQLNKDVKELLNQFAIYFPQIGKATRTEHKIIILASDFNDIHFFESYSFTKNEPKKSRLRETFFAIFEILSEKRSLRYSELLTDLIKHLNINENIEIIRTPESDNGNEESKIEDDEDISESRKEDGIFPMELENLISPNSNSSENDENVGNDFLEKNVNDYSNTICDEVDIVMVKDRFCNLCTERQRIIFGYYLLKEYSNQLYKEFKKTYGQYEPDPTELSKRKLSYEQAKKRFKELPKNLGFETSTLYTENSKAQINFEHIAKYYQLSGKQKAKLLRRLLSDLLKSEEGIEDVS